MTDGYSTSQKLQKQPVSSYCRQANEKLPEQDHSLHKAKVQSCIKTQQNAYRFCNFFHWHTSIALEIVEETTTIQH